MSISPHDPTDPVGLPGTSAPAVPGTGPSAAAPAAASTTAPAATPTATPSVWENTPAAPPQPAPTEFRGSAPVAPGTAGSVYVPPPTAYGAPAIDQAPPQYGAPQAPPPYAYPAASAPPYQQPYGAPPPAAAPPYQQPYGAPPPDAYAPPYQQPLSPQPPSPPYHYGQPVPPGYVPPPELGDQIPGAVAHETYTDERFNRHQSPQPALDANGQPLKKKVRKREPTAWNRWALIMLALFVTALGALVYPQYRARSTEHELRPLVVGLAGHNAWARCPRYITSVFTYVGAVAYDGKGDLSDHTELTGPICSGLRHLYTPAGRAEMSCLVTTGNCSQSALNSVIALATITHESMHLRGILDEGQAECGSVAAAQKAAVLAGLTSAEGRMIGYLHLMAMNPDTPPQYHLTPSNCPSSIPLAANPPGTAAMRNTLVYAAQRTWMHIASG